MFLAVFSATGQEEQILVCLLLCLASSLPEFILPLLKSQLCLGFCSSVSFGARFESTPETTHIFEKTKLSEGLRAGSYPDLLI